PVVLIRWRVRNTGDTETEIECGMRWPNVVGYGGGIKEEEKKIGYGDGFYQYWTAPDQPTTDAVKIPPVVGLGLAHGNAPNPVSQAADGRHFLFVKSPNEHRSVAVDLEQPGVCAVTSLAPGAESVVDMVLVWEMPHWIDTRRVDQGLFWQNHFEDGGEVAEHALEHFDAILEGAGWLGELLGSTSLPADIRHRLLNCCYPLVTNSVFFRDGRFSINEGPTEMSGCYGTIDQRLGAHPATQLLFPELNAAELTLFAKVQAEDGAINHDLGHGHLDKSSAPIPWPDLCCSFVIQHARHAWTTGDADFAKRAWPKIRKAIEKHGSWADAGNGVAQLGKLGTSYDSYHYIGTTAYMGTLWIAALKIARIWAEDEGDTPFIEKIDRRLAAAAERLETDLWNGRFYRAYASPDNPTNENSHAGMLAGEVFSRLLAGQDVLPRERLVSCVESLMQLNCSEQMAVPADEAAPDGGAASLYGWLPYIEAFALTAGMMFAPETALGVWQRMIAAMQGENDLHPCDTRLMYRPQTGAPSWGAYYMTAPASWLVYDAMLDFRCHPIPGILRFNPVQNGTFALVHPRFWALGKRDGNSLEIEVTRSFGGTPVSVCILETHADVASTSAPLAQAETPPSPAAGPYQQTTIAPLPLKPGARIAWTLSD
ncbi:MAG: GH116 family glycosyl hydrolase, partial [Verrucomicrobiota bacterium]